MNPNPNPKNMKSKTLTRVCSATVALVLAALPAFAQNVWTGGGGANQNWSQAANWSLGAVPAGDQVVFQDAGAVGTVGTVNNIVDAGFSGFPASLQYANTTNTHTTFIPNGVTLNLTGSLIAGTEVAADIAGKTNTITGLGGSLVANASGGNFIVRQWPVAASSSASRTTLDMSGLGNFTGSFGRLLIGVAGSGGGNRASGRLILARTNVISLNGADPQLDLGDSSSNNGNGSQLFLGQTNALFANSLTIGRYKERAVLMSFASGLSNPTLYLRGSDTSSRVNLWVIGYMGNGSATANAQGTVDLSAGSLNAQVEVLEVGKASDYTGSSGTTGPGTGTLTIGAGTLDVNTVRIGYQPRGTSAAATTSGQGTINVNGTAKLTVNNLLGFGVTSGGTGVASTYGTLNINGGTVTTPDITADGGGTNNAITISGNGKLVVTNGVTAGIRALSMTNGGLTINALSLSPVITVSALSLGGTTNTINISEIRTLAAYPAQLPLIKYSGAVAGTFNFGLGTVPPSSPAYVGYISNNVANGTIDLVLTSGKAPARSLAWSGATDSSWDTLTPNWTVGASPATYNEADFVRFDDKATGSTSVNLTGTRTPSNVTVSNQAKAYILGGGGNLSGPTGIVKDGAAKLTIATSGINENTGGLTILAGTVQVGDGTGAGNLGSGDIQNNSALIFAHPGSLAVADPISGTGTLTQNGSGTVILGGANTYSGPTTVSQGTLQTLHTSALGTTNAGTTVASGATLDFYGRNVGLEPVTVGGAGVGNNGALVSTGTNDIFPAVAFVTMTGNTWFGGTARWDLRSANTGDPSQSSLLTGGQPFKLIKVGGNQVGIVGTTVDPALGDVEIQGGILGLEGATTGLGNPTSTLTISPGAQLKFFNTTNVLNKRIVLSSDGLTGSIRNDSGANTIVGPITMTTDCSFTLDGGTLLTLAGPLNGGVLSLTGAGDATIAGAATHAGTVVSAGKLTLSGSHTGGITNNSILVGTGTNTGFTDNLLNLMPGETNVPGTLTLGGLALEGSSRLFLDLGPTKTVGGGVNDLLQVNGNLVVNPSEIIINPQGLLLEGPANAYTIIKYTGTLTWNGDPTVSGPFNYLFTIDRNTAGEIKLVVSGGPPVWTGGSATGNNWLDAANWGGTAINSGDTLYFAGNARLNNNNDTLVESLYSDLAFAAGAGSFTLNGNRINLGVSILNGSVNTQTVNLDINFGAPGITLNGKSGTLVIGGRITNTTDVAPLTLAGTGILTNQFYSPSLITNILVVTSTNADWTLMDNASSTAITNPTQLDIQGGSLTFGAPGSAPKLTSTTGLNSRLGFLPGVPATLNMVNGTLAISARLNTGGGANTIAVINQTGGRIDCLDIFQGADSTGSATSTMNISGGVFSVGEIETSPNALYLCSRGTGTLNISGTGQVRCGVFDASRNASGAGSVGTINLNGGLLDVERIGTGTGAFGAGGTPTATINFNGGVLKARASAANFISGRAEIPIASIVKAGGAVVDSSGFDITIAEPLQHDSALGGTLDGGLTKNGAGILTLSRVSTYTGPTVVNAGTLRVTGAVGDSGVTVTSEGRLDGTGTIGGTVVVNGTVAPGVGAIGILTVTNGVTLAGTTVMEINQTTRTNDVLRTITGSIQYGGTLQVTNLAGTLQNGSSFKLFTAGNGTYTGTFANYDLPAIGNGGYWDVSRLGVDGTIMVALPPSITNVVATGGNLVINGGSGAPNGSYEVLSATEVTTPIASWTVVGSGTFSATGTFSTSVPIDPGTPRRFFVIRML
jgi:autotransporter-associated beta strand protein